MRSFRFCATSGGICVLLLAVATTVCAQQPPSRSDSAASDPREPTSSSNIAAAGKDHAVLLVQRGQGGRKFQGGRGQGRGGAGGGQQGGRGRGQGMHGGRDARHDEDHAVFQFLLQNHEKIKRTVKELPTGVDTLTESDDPAVAAKIKEHVKWMDYRVENVKPIRMRDPLFAELFRSAEKINMDFENTERGVRVVETSDDPRVVTLIKAHAKVVSGFVARGFQEAMKNHPVPDANQVPGANPAPGAKRPGFAYSNPKIEKYGAVVTLADSVQQPRNGSRIAVDVTGAGDPSKIHPSVEKVARYVNLYAGGGQQPAEVRIAMVLHGGATLTALNDDVYGQEFGVEANPNLDCLHSLHEAGVEIYVCGQSLVGKDHHPQDTAVFIDVAVSALTSLVNLQSDGYAYIPLGN